jgi:hypothetical protein
MQQAVLTEKERFTQMQWDMEELRRKCLETEMKLKFEEVCLVVLIKFNQHLLSFHFGGL